MFFKQLHALEPTVTFRAGAVVSLFGCMDYSFTFVFKYLNNSVFRNIIFIIIATMISLICSINLCPYTARRSEGIPSLLVGVKMFSRVTTWCYHVAVSQSAEFLLKRELVTSPPLSPQHFASRCSTWSEAPGGGMPGCWV